MRDSDYTMCSLKTSFHDVHMFPADGVVQPEGFCVVGGDFQRWQLSHGTPALMSHVVNDKHTPCVGHLVVLSIMGLH